MYLGLITSPALLERSKDISYSALSGTHFSPHLLTQEKDITMSSTNSPSDPDGQTGKLCNWVQSVALEDVPADVQTRAKYLILDGIACALVGAHLPWSEKAATGILEMEPSGDCDIFGWERVCPNYSDP